MTDIDPIRRLNDVIKDSAVQIAAAERRGYNRAIAILRAVNWGDAADYLAKHPDPAPKGDV